VQKIDAFLDAYKPKPICLPCLAQVTGRTADDVWKTVTALLDSRQAQTDIAECLNCATMKFVVRSGRRAA
jgi:hypothetical protein